MMAVVPLAGRASGMAAFGWPPERLLEVPLATERRFQVALGANGSMFGTDGFEEFHSVLKNEDRRFRSFGLSNGVEAVIVQPPFPSMTTRLVLHLPIGGQEDPHSLDGGVHLLEHLLVTDMTQQTGRQAWCWGSTAMGGMLLRVQAYAPDIYNVTEVFLRRLHDSDWIDADRVLKGVEEVHNEFHGGNKQRNLIASQPAYDFLVPGHPWNRRRSCGNRQTLLGDRSIDELVSIMKALHHCYIHAHRMKAVFFTNKDIDGAQGFLERVLSRVPADAPPPGPVEEKYCLRFDDVPFRLFVPRLGHEVKVRTSLHNDEIGLVFPRTQTTDAESKEHVRGPFRLLADLMRRGSPALTEFFEQRAQLATAMTLHEDNFLRTMRPKQHKDAVFEE
eukprot:Polyplicarium_translucidae@DN3320_c2_g1_i7.p1